MDQPRWETRGRAQRRARAQDQFGMPIMQSLKRCACIWPIWLRPSPSVCLLADHRAAFLFKRLVLVPCMGLLRGLSRSRQRDQRKHQYDRPHLHLSLRVGFAIREINLRASRAFCEIFVTLACWPYVACRRCRACDQRGCVQRSRLQRDRSRGRADMKRRESGKSARHARRDGWRAPLLTMLKYCRHKTTPKIVMREYRSTRTQDCARTERSTTIRVPPSSSAREYCIPVFVKTYGSDVAMRPSPLATRCRGE